MTVRRRASPYFDLGILFQVLIAGTLIIAVVLLARFLVEGTRPASSDIKLCLAVYVVLWFAEMLSAREDRQKAVLDEIKSRLDSIEKRMK